MYTLITPVGPSIRSTNKRRQSLLAVVFLLGMLAAGGGLPKSPVNGEKFALGDSALLCDSKQAAKRKGRLATNIMECLQTLDNVHRLPITIGYVDPGSGALVYQLLISALVGVMFYFRRLLFYLRRSINGIAIPKVGNKPNGNDLDVDK